VQSASRSVDPCGLLLIGLGKFAQALRDEKAFAAKVTGSEKVFAAERRLEFSPAF
jgi:hypothetical protein